MKIFRNDKGGVLLETALWFPLLVLMLFSAVMFGLVFNAQNVVVSAAREGARTAAVLQSEGEARERVERIITGQLHTGGGARFDRNRDVRVSMGTYCTVAVTYRVPCPTPFLARLLLPPERLVDNGRHIGVSAMASFRRESAF